MKNVISLKKSIYDLCDLNSKKNLLTEQKSITAVDGMAYKYSITGIKQRSGKTSKTERIITINEKIQESIYHIESKIYLVKNEILLSLQILHMNRLISFVEQEQICDYYIEEVPDHKMKFKYGKLWKSKIQKVIDKNN
jgi:hypothetical protein